MNSTAELVQAVEKVAAELKSNPLMHEYIKFVDRKVNALKANPSPAYAQQVIEDLILMGEKAAR